MKAIALNYRQPSPSLTQYCVLVGDTEIMLSEVKPNSVLDAHRHKETQIGIGLSGNLDFAISDDRYDLRKKKVYIIDSDVAHSGANASSEPFIGIDIKLPATNSVSSIFGVSCVSVDGAHYHVSEYQLDDLPIGIQWIKAYTTHQHESAGLHIYLSGSHSIFDTKAIYQYQRGDLVYADTNDLEYIRLKVRS